MKVKAKCIAKAWDSTTTTFYYPGEEYTIDHDGQLATLRVGRGFVFEFDRTMAGTGLQPALGGYACKQCPMVFDSLNDIGNHSNSVHKTKMVEREPEKEPLPEPVLAFKCDKCDKRFKDKRGVVGHARWAHKEVAETVAVPA